MCSIYLVIICNIPIPLINRIYYLYMVYVLIWPLARMCALAKARTNTTWYICTVYDVVG
jgi:hypothetical protein